MEDENKGSSGFPIDRYVSDMKRQNTQSSSSMAPIESAGCWISDAQDTLEFSFFFPFHCLVLAEKAQSQKLAPVLSYTI